MFCGNCGTKHSEGFGFCANCGTKAEPLEVTGGHQAPIQAQVPTPAPRAKKKPKGAIIALLCLLLLGGGIFIWRTQGGGNVPDSLREWGTPREVVGGWELVDRNADGNWVPWPGREVFLDDRFVFAADGTGYVMWGGQREIEFNWRAREGLLFMAPQQATSELLEYVTDLIYDEFSDFGEALFYLEEALAERQEEINRETNRDFREEMLLYQGMLEALIFLVNEMEAGLNPRDLNFYHETALILFALMDGLTSDFGGWYFRVDRNGQLILTEWDSWGNAARMVLEPAR